MTAENLDVACQVIEKVATEKAIIEIDSSLASAYEARRRHRDVSLESCLASLSCVREGEGIV